MEESAYYKSEKHYQNLIEGSTDLIALIDGNGTILYTSPSIQRILGYSKIDCIGEDVFSFIHDHDRIRIKNHIKEYFNLIHDGLVFPENNNNYTFPVKQYRVIAEDSSIKTLQTGIRTQTAGKLENSVFIVNAADITDLVYLQKKIFHEKEKAVTANNAKSIFLANMSHELKTPLNSILGFSQMLETSTSGENAEKIKKYSRIINDSGAHLLEIVNDILDLSKIEAGKVSITKSDILLNPFIQHFILPVTYSAQEKGVNLTYSVKDDHGILNADEVRLKQILYNLLSNAIKFTDAGKNVVLTVTSESGYAVFSIVDEGIGIERENLKRVFRPFEQDRHEASVKNRGTGLGLTITKNLVKAHNGIITVRSTPGKGSMFTVKLPEYRVRKRGDNGTENGKD